MSRKKRLQPPDVIILIADQFDEMEVVTCHSALSNHQLSVVLVSIKPGLVQSIHGITVHPDSYLSQELSLASEKRQLIVLAGGETCAAQTLSDPRSHQLIQDILQQNGFVAVMSRADYLVRETGMFMLEREKGMMRQGEVETAVFVQQLIDRMNTN
ncbi:MAG: hypothetical protein DWQ04_34725 [Chloroflexi bacterium]|nr:MAG: hypothetical protein DWQ04_34725 [Chloroflexota bacterium]